MITNPKKCHKLQEKIIILENKSNCIKIILCDIVIGWKLKHYELLLFMVYYSVICSKNHLIAINFLVQILWKVVRKNLQQQFQL